MTEKGKARAPGQMPKRTLSSAYWLIARDENCPIEVLTVDRGDEKVLPVFGFEEEAELFLRLEALGNGWRVRESGAGEIISLLYGPCTSTGHVALDPLPQVVAERAAGHVSLSRERFVDRVTAVGRPRLNRPNRGLLLQITGSKPEEKGGPARCSGSDSRMSVM